ncbi:dynamin family protein [Sciscionella sediminilitoris]|uniref:dynamin family protein n=1 Tax=Sciscionella sediminilitoris TaxID=1445613 RepID=UPI0004DEE786|nr:dynamin family protein [Sciscionella sp. SE31]
MRRVNSFPEQVRTTREQLVNFLADCDPEAATWVRGVHETRRSTPSVVVVGETNRGKSSLVNALLASPGLSPVDAEVATATYLVFGHGEAMATRACYPQREPVPFPPEQLLNWASAAHELPDGELPPRYVEVDAPIPLLERLQLVDTPGVGGLDSMHGELATEAAASATALLFVVDASGPLTSGELGFLRKVADSVETVLFALTKTDSHRGYRQVAEANKELLAEHAPRFANVPMYPVSARMFDMAATAPNEQAARVLRERSGIPDLQQRLQEQVAGRAAMLAEANTLRALTTAFNGLRTELESRHRALSTGEDEIATLRERRDELTTQRRSSTRGYQVKLRAEIQRARIEGTHDVGRQMRELTTWFRGAIDSANRERLAQLPAEVDSAMQLVSGRISQSLADRLTKVTEVTLAEVFSDGELQVLRAEFAKQQRPFLELRPPDKRAGTAEDKLMVSMGVYSGFGVARMATSFAPGVLGLGAAALNPFLLPVTIVVGLGAGVWMARTRKHQAEKTHMKTWLTEAIADARSTLDQLVSEQIISAESQLSLALDEALGQRIEAIEAEIKSVDKTLKLETAERNSQLQRITRQLQDLSSGEGQLGNLLARIRDLRDR